MDPKNRLNDNEDTVNTNINRVRARPFRLTDDYVTLAHGSGGKASAALVENVFYGGYGNEVLDARGDMDFRLPQIISVKPCKQNGYDS